VKPRAGNIASEIKNVYNISQEKPLGKCPHERPRRE
jgi:hypothetical protein